MRRLWLIFSQAVTVALAVLFVVNTLKPHWLAREASTPDVVSIRAADPPPPAASAVATAASTNPPGANNYSSAAKRAAPAVVSVASSKAGAPNPHAQDPWFRRFFGDQAPGDEQRGFGSGVIVSPEGYLLTNNHVVEGASEVDVRLTDGREARARVVGTDPDSDLAVLKIELDRLPAVTFGNTDALQVGDPVLAIGNPFNVGQTVTAGIVSALGRNQLGLSTFENFIQTDAAINPGNSGGALVDLNGHLVGINTAIFSQSGGSLGIGFAIPADIARQVMEGLIKDGVVTRGWIGVEPRELTPEFVENFKLPVRDGVLITGVLQDGPASKGGMRPGDVVVSVAGRPVATTAQLLNAVAQLKPGEEAALGVQRGGQAMELKVTAAQRPTVPQQRPAR
jgi:serine protease DegQ